MPAPSTNWVAVTVSSTNWFPEDLIPSAGDLLLETGSYFLMENGDKLLFE